VGLIISLTFFHLKVSSLVVFPAYGPIILSQGWTISFVTSVYTHIYQNDRNELSWHVQISWTHLTVTFKKWKY